MPVTIRPYNIGCMPSPSVPAETLLQNSRKTYLLFWAVSETLQETGQLTDRGVAILDCVNCASAKMGYPNDEGLPEHPFYEQGLSDIAVDVVEISGSAWLSEINEQEERSARRIWGGRGMTWSSRHNLRKHFMVTLKEMTFECLAEQLRVVEYAKDFPSAYAYVIAEFMQHEDD